MDVAFIAMLFLTSLTGMALLVLRETAAMGPLLALHLGVVFALFITMPYGKFVHGIYRFVALVRYARERRMMGAHLRSSLRAKRSNPFFLSRRALLRRFAPRNDVRGHSEPSKDDADDGRFTSENLETPGWS